MIPLLLPLLLPSAAPAQLKIEAGRHIGRVQAAVSLGGGRYATVGDDKTVRFWSAKGRQERVAHYPSGAGEDGMPMGLWTGGGSVFVGTHGAKDAVYRIEKDDAAKPAASAPPGSASVLFDDGRTLATLTPQLDLRVGPLGGGGSQTKVAAPGGDPFLAASTDAKRLVVAVSTDGGSVVEAHDAKTLKIVGAPAKAPAYLRAVADDGARVWLAGERYAALWKPGEGPTKLALPDGVWEAVAPTKNGGAVFVGLVNGPDGMPLGGRAVAVDEGGAVRWTGVLGLGNGTMAASGADGGVLVGTALGDLFRLDAQGTPTRFGAAPDFPVDIAWAKDEKGASTIEWSVDFDREKRKAPQYVRAFDLAAQNPVDPLPTAEGGKLRFEAGAVLRPDGKRLALPDKGDQIEAAAALPDGRVVVSSGGLLTCVLSASGKKETALDCDLAQVFSLAVSPDGRYLAASGSDAIIRIFAVKDLQGAKARPMIALFTQKNLAVAKGGVDDDWILWSDRECLYASSVNGDKMLNLQRDLDDGSVLFESVETRQNAYRRPERLRKALEVGSVQQAVENTDDAQKAPVTQTASARIQLLRIADAEPKPEGGYLASKAEVKLRFRVSEGVQRLRLSENVFTKDVEAASMDREGSDTLVWPASLSPGENRLKVVGVLEDGTTSEPVEVKIDLPGDALGTMRVLVIGVTGYTNVPDLPTNANDAKRVADHFAGLKGKPGVGNVEVTVVPAAQTDHAGIRDALTKFQASIEKNDVAVLYVSSHGMAGKGSDGFVMLPRDYDPAVKERHGILWQTVVDAISNKPCKAAILLQDACHSGGVTKDVPSPELKDARVAADQMALRRNLFVFSSCQSNEVSQVDRVHGISVFTRALLEGLDGQLPYSANLDGQVLLSTVHGSIPGRVEEIINELVKNDAIPKVYKGGRERNPSQVPQFYAPWAEVMPIVMGFKEATK